MAVVAVTRLRLRDVAQLEDFLTAALALLEQAKRAAGVLGSDAIAETNSTWWTCTVWDSRASMRSFVRTDPHRATMDRLDDWCDEATFVDWEQPGSELPDWKTSHAHIVAEGQSATLTYASPANATLDFPVPVPAT